MVANEMSMKRVKDWWTASWNIVTGCTPVGAGCDHCWARAMVRRFPSLHGKPHTHPEKSNPAIWSEVLCHPALLEQPMHWRKSRVIAVSLLGDLFHEQVPDAFIHDAIRVMAHDRCTHHRFVLLTKRPARAWDWEQYGLHNVIVLASVWDQRSCDDAFAAFEQLRGVQWGLHVEPMLEPIVAMNVWAECRTGLRDLRPSWIVCGDETGPGARPMDPQWAFDLREQCRLAAVPFWFKGNLHNIYRALRGKSKLKDLAQTREVPW